MSEINIYEIYKMSYACIFETSLTQTARFKREKKLLDIKRTDTCTGDVQSIVFLALSLTY